MQNDPRQNHTGPDGQDQFQKDGNDRQVDQSRRTFSKAGLIAAPVIMTLASKSALGANYRCTVSGLISGNASHAGAIEMCAGGTPSYWMSGTFFQVNGNNGKVAQITPWPTPYAGVTPFSTTCGGGVFAPSTFTYQQGNGINSTKCYSLYEVLALTNGATIYDSRDPDQLGAHTVAALLNAAAAEQGLYQFAGGVEYGLTPNQVISLFNTYHSSKPSELKTLFSIWNQTYGTERDAYKSAISALGLVIPQP